MQVETEQLHHLGAFRRLIEEGFSRGDVGVVDEVCSEEFVEHQFGVEPANRDGLKGAIGFLHRLSPDIEVTIEDSAIAGDQVWARFGAGAPTAATRWVVRPAGGLIS